MTHNLCLCYTIFAQKSVTDLDEFLAKHGQRSELISGYDSDDFSEHAHVFFWKEDFEAYKLVHEEFSVFVCICDVYVCTSVCMYVCMYVRMYVCL